MTSARNAIDVYAHHRGECRVASPHRGSIRTVPLLSTHHSNVDVFSLCAVVEEYVSGSLVGPPTASSAHRASHTHPQRGSSSDLHVGSKRRNSATQ